MKVNVMHDMLASFMFCGRQAASSKVVQSNLQLIGILRWAVELWQIDIFYEVFVLSQEFIIALVLYHSNVVGNFISETST